MVKKTKKKTKKSSAGAKSAPPKRKRAAKKKDALALCGHCGGHLMLPSKLTTKSLVKPIPIVLKGLGAGTMDGVGTRVITITATPTNATAFVVNLDGQQLALGAGQPSTRPISQGAHMMTAIVFGNQGASLSVSGVIAGQAGVSCHCTVDPAGNPGADPEPFNVT